MRGRLLLLLSVNCFCAWPMVCIVAIVAPMGDPAPDDPQANSNPAYPREYLLWLAAIALPLIATVCLVARERWLERRR